MLEEFLDLLDGWPNVDRRLPNVDTTIIFVGVNIGQFMIYGGGYDDIDGWMEGPMLIIDCPMLTPLLFLLV